jgi:hypothetical protein
MISGGLARRTTWPTTESALGADTKKALRFCLKRFLDSIVVPRMRRWPLIG